MAETSEMVELVARAICERGHRINLRLAELPEIERDIQVNVDMSWRSVVEEAEAAIQAIREPTPHIAPEGMSADEIFRVLKYEIIRQADNAYGEKTAERRSESEYDLYMNGTFDFFEVARALAIKLGTEPAKKPFKLHESEVIDY